MKPAKTCCFHTYRYDPFDPYGDTFWPCGDCPECREDLDVIRFFDTGDQSGLWTKKGETK